MNASPQQIQLGLDDLLGELLYARRRGDLGRLALLACFEVRRWARMAGYQGLADHASKLITHAPHANREAFLVEVDGIMGMNGAVTFVNWRISSNGSWRFLWTDR